jgi:glutamate-1-semialdehyde aminotransferase
MYFEHGRGAELTDVDGHHYVDFLMAFGAVLLGYARPEVDAAAASQGARGRLLSLNHPLHIEFIEQLLPHFPWAEQGIFFRTGSEATTAALRIARQRTGRRRIARSGYHGWHDWCLPLEPFVPAGLDAQVPEFRASDPDTLRALFAEQPGTIAAVIVAPEMVLPHEPQIFHELLRITHAQGALFIMDEVKTGLRIAPGSIAERAGIEPDMITISKALGNGFPIAATLGKRDVMQVASGMHYSATFHGETSAMAAALATLEIVRRERVQQRLEQLGQSLLDGLNTMIRGLELPAVAYPEPLPAMPFLRFVHPDAELQAALTRCFFQEVLAAGVLLHPRHLWFVSHSHTPEHIDRTLSACRHAFEQVRELLRA